MYVFYVSADVVKLCVMEVTILVFLVEKEGMYGITTELDLNMQRNWACYSESLCSSGCANYLLYYIGRQLTVDPPNRYRYQVGCPIQVKNKTGGENADRSRSFLLFLFLKANT